MVLHNTQKFSRQFFHPLPTEKEEVNLCCIKCRKELKTKVLVHKITSSAGPVYEIKKYGESEECNHEVEE